MEALDSWIVTLAVFLPVGGVVALLFIPRTNELAAKFTALIASGLALLAGIAVLWRFDFSRSHDVQLAVKATWIPQIDVNYHVGVDGISLPLLLLSLFITFLCVIYSFDHIPEPGNTKAFLALVLLLETGMSGTFVAFDLILFFIFWELVLLPMYFLIGLWGGPRKEYAAIKFFLYTLLGSAFMLLAFLALFFKSGTFDILELSSGAANFSRAAALVVFGGLFLGFAIKVPMFPFHTWLPDAHTEAPTVGSVLLAAVLLKMGTYGFVRIALPILPDAARSWAPAIGILGAIGIVYAALCCMAQSDLKRLIAFSSVGHMGFVMLGIATLTPIGINAAIFGMLAHGVITGMLFFLAGSIHERYHTREISELGGGMLKKVPIIASILAFTSFASLGLPGLAGFWGEVPALLASYQPAPGLSETTFRTLMVAGGIGTVLVAGYFLWMLQRVNLGEVPLRWQSLEAHDINPYEIVSWTPLIALTVIMGVYPKLIFGVTNGAVEALARIFGS
jgi:NADH-quinone oxidoreductase subunit M